MTAVHKAAIIKINAAAAWLKCSAGRRANPWRQSSSLNVVSSGSVHRINM